VNTQILDLHGVRHYQVDLKVEDFAYKQQENLPASVMCGNSNKMILLVKETLDRIGFLYSEPRYGIVMIISVN
jgi:hypothetical protein